MPGLFGIVSASHTAAATFLRMKAESSLGPAISAETLEDGIARMGCTKVQTGFDRKVFETHEILLGVNGYFTSKGVIEHPDHAKHGPAAIIASAYGEHGQKSLRNLCGTFSLAIWEKDSGTLHLMTDLMGLRPIFYAELANGIAFAPDLETLVRATGINRDINLEAVSDFFVHNYVMGEKSFVTSVKLVPPGSIMTWCRGRIQVEKYDDLPYPNQHQRRSDQELDEIIDTTIRDAVRRTTTPGLRYGLSLSGGMDSRWLAIHLRDAPLPVTAFTFGSEDSDDALIAAEVAAELGIQHVRFDLEPNFIATYGHAISRMTGGMYNLKDSQEYPLGVRLAGAVDVNLGGMLGDILFGHEMNPLYRRLRIRQLPSYWMWRTKKLRLPIELMDIAFGKNAARDICASARRSLQIAIDRAPCEHAYQIAQYVNLRERQRRFINVAQLLKLAYTDVRHPLADREVISMALGIEPNQLMMERAYRRSMVNRHPNLGDILWTYTLQSPRASAASIYTKRIFQVVFGKTLAKIRLPSNAQAVTPRSVTSYDSWTRTVLRPYIESELFSDEALSLGIFDVAGLRKLVDLHMRGAENLTGFICQALSLATWARGWNTPSPKP